MPLCPSLTSTREQVFIYMTACYVFYCVVKSFIFGKHSNASGILENPPWFYSHFMWAVINQLREIEKWDWDYSTRGLNPSKVLSFCDWNLQLCFFFFFFFSELEYRLPFSLSSGLPYWSINRQVVRLKSSPICSQGPNWSWRSGEVYFSIGLLSLWIQQQWWTRLCVCVVLLSCFLLPFSISKPVIFIFHDILHNKFKCLLSSSNQTVGDILEKKWNKMLCD